MMRLLRILNATFLLLLVLSIASCGRRNRNNGPGVNGGPPPPGTPFGPGQFGQCAPPGPNMRIERAGIRGEFGIGGAYIEMDLYTNGADSVFAVGILHVADMAQIDFRAPPGAPYVTCVSGTGSIRRFANISDELIMVMNGDHGTRIDMGQNGAITTLAGNRLNGSLFMTVNGSDVLMYTLSP